MRTVYHYKGFWNCDAKCGLEIKRDNGKVTVILTELDDNPGTSVTNMVEQLATMVYHQFLKDTPVEDITWIEHYPPNPKAGLEILRKGTFDRVTMNLNGKQFSNPRWERIKELI